MAQQEAYNQQEQEQFQGPVTQWVTFSLADETYGIDVMRVQEVLPMSEIAPVPGAPRFVLGIINLRGNVVTVIDTRMRFGLESRDADKASRIVVIETGDQVAGILVDSVAEVMNVREDEVDTAPNVGNEESSKYIYGVVSRGDELLILVDVNKLLSRDEWEEISSL